MAEWKWRCELIEKAAAGWPNLKLGSQQSAPTNLSLRQADLWANHLEWIHTFRQTKICWALFASHVIIFLGTLVIQLQDDPALPFHKLHFASECCFLPSKVNIYFKQLFLSFWWFIEFNMLEKLQETQSGLINLHALQPTFLQTSWAFSSPFMFPQWHDGSPQSGRCPRQNLNPSKKSEPWPERRPPTPWDK